MVGNGRLWALADVACRPVKEAQQPCRETAGARLTVGAFKPLEGTRGGSKGPAGAAWDPSVAWTECLKVVECGPAAFGGNGQVSCRWEAAD